MKEYLSAWDETFDLLIFHDYLGLGYYTALARKLGLGFADTQVMSVVHGPSEWARSLNLAADQPDDIPVYVLEQRQVEMSDHVVGPSQHILDWCAERGWALPATARAISNLLPVRLDCHTGLAPGSVAEGLDEVVFFGRLEIRKGLFEFLDSIGYLHKNGLRKPRRVTFLGQFSWIAERHSASIILDHAKGWDCELRFLNGLDHEAAITYLVDRRPLVVIPSHDESFGLTAYECLEFGIPVLIADRGALSGLPADRDVLVAPQAHLIARRIDAALRDGMLLSAVDPAHVTAAEDWDRLLEDIAGTPGDPGPEAALVTSGGLVSATPEGEGGTLVSVILVHHNRPRMLSDALDSLRAQTHEDLEIIVVDDGSRPADLASVRRLVEAAADDRITLIEQANAYLGAARNTGAARASGEFLLFMDDDNIAHPREVETLLAVARRTGADVLTGVSRMFRSEDAERRGFDIYCPVGPSLPLAVFGNPFGDANSLVRRSAFDTVGGFTERYGVGCEDYEFFTRAFTAGLKMQLVPEILFDYRADEDGMMRELNSGKYLVNHTRGTTALFDTDTSTSLVEMRHLMRVGQTAGMARERAYWAEEGARGRQFPDLERELSEHRNHPNAPQAIAVVVRLMAAYGRLGGAMDLLERAGIAADVEMLGQLQRLMTLHARHQANSGIQPNIAINPAFEFWDLGTRFDGIKAYQYVANDWLLPSSKDRPALVASAERDNALFALSRARQASHIRLRLLEPDPEGYLFLTQRNTDLGRVLGNVMRVSVLGRGSFDGALTAFMRVTKVHGTEDFRDIWPDRQGWIGRNWARSEFRFDLTAFDLDATAPDEFVSLFFRIPTDAAMTLDLADATILPEGEAVSMAPYIREAERQRVEERCFRTGSGAVVTPRRGDVAEIAPDPALSARLDARSRLRVHDAVTLDLGRGSYVEVRVEEVWRDAESGAIRMRLDPPLSGPATALADFLQVTKYIEG